MWSALRDSFILSKSSTVRSALKQTNYNVNAVAISTYKQSYQFMSCFFLFSTFMIRNTTYRWQSMLKQHSVMWGTKWYTRHKNCKFWKSLTIAVPVLLALFTNHVSCFAKYWPGNTLLSFTNYVCVLIQTNPNKPWKTIFCLIQTWQTNLSSLLFWPQMSCQKWQDLCVIEVLWLIEKRALAKYIWQPKQVNQ